MDSDLARRRRLLHALARASAALAVAGLLAGPQGLTPAAWHALVDDWHAGQAGLILGEIRAPRTLGAWG
ncbi:MAG: hypothetical protein HY856_00180, partial [Burkholderiales bacterium]|nr:hypothetical protein [Burkholderiales bacterium]